MALKDLVRRRAVASTPAPIENSIATEGMDGSTSFGPGRPINPFFGYSTRPRAFDYPVGANITTRPREAYGRMSFGFMKTLIDAYWLAGACIDHKIKNLQSMELLFSPADGVDYDVTGAIKAARAALAFPDRELPFESWLSKWLEGVFRYDAGCLYRHRDRAGRVIGLDVVDGSTIAPYIDEHGRRPKPPAPAYAQLVKGVPGYWLTSDDLIYTPFRPQVDSPYGRAPIEAIQINANTDLRFQMWCLQYFTAGSTPAGFLKAPESVSTPDQVQQWQDFWDALMVGDQEALRQIKVIPHDMTFEPVRDPTFDERFPLHLARITCAAYGVVPQDLGITMDVNRAVGETQLDVQFRINDRPVMMFAQNILTNYVQRDLGLPVAVTFDDGQAKEDRLHEAQAWQIYTNSGYASVDEARAKLLGLPVDPSRPVPRIILDPRIGPVPLSSIEAVSGRINPHSLSPAADAPLPQVTPDTAAPAIVANKASGEPAAPVNPEPPQFIPAPKHPADGTPSVANPEAVAKATEGVTAETGLEGVDLGQDDEEEQERAAFGRFVKARARKGVWRDFTFTYVGDAEASRLNLFGWREVRKAAGQPIAAGLAVVAADTGRVLMIQRGLDDDDPAQGTWEIPGGHIEEGESPKQAAYREWQEETGVLLPYVPESPDASWTSSSGVYEGYLWVIPSESDIDLVGRHQVNDPDGDSFEAVAWIDPADLASMPLRPELAADLDLVMPVLTTDVAKAASGDPKARPASRFEQQLVAHWTTMLQSAIRTLTPVATLAAQLVAMFAATADAIIESAVAASIRIDRDVLSGTLKALYADGYVAGAKDVAGEAPQGSLADELTRIDWTAWTPGKTAPTKLAADSGFDALADQIAQRVTGIDETTRNLIAQAVRDGVAQHKPTGRIADDIETVLSDPKRARLIAVTEVNRAMSAGAMAMYRANGIDAWDLVTAPDPCPICQAIKDANPHPISDTQIPPEHPACRCAVAAHVEV